MNALSIPPLTNILGFLALAAYILTIIPTNLKIVFPATKQTSTVKKLFKYRRIIGIGAFFLALMHGFLLVKKRDFDFFDPHTYWIYIQGVATFIIFTLLAITSNDWSMKRLKKNWKRLHTLTYIAMFLLTWHVWEKMSEHWSHLTPIGLGAIITTNILFLLRRRIEIQNQQHKKPNTLSSEKLVGKRM